MNNEEIINDNGDGSHRKGRTKNVGGSRTTNSTEIRATCEIDNGVTTEMIIALVKRCIMCWRLSFCASSAFNRVALF